MFLEVKGCAHESKKDEGVLEINAETGDGHMSESGNGMTHDAPPHAFLPSVSIPILNLRLTLFASHLDRLVAQPTHRLSADGYLLFEETEQAQPLFPTSLHLVIP